MHLLRTQTSNFFHDRPLYETLWHRESSVKLLSVFPSLISATIAFTFLVFLPSGSGSQTSKSWIHVQQWVVVRDTILRSYVRSSRGQFQSHTVMFVRLECSQRFYLCTTSILFCLLAGHTSRVVWVRVLMIE